MKMLTKSRGVHSARSGRIRSLLARAIAIATIGAAVGGGALASAPPAMAYSSGIFGYCNWVYLPAHGSCADYQYHSSFVQVESWNADAAGVGTCAAVGNAAGTVWYDYVCVGNGSGYNAALCHAACSYDAGYGQVGDDSPWGSLFTGWGEWR
jgi:hypothetical protein